MASMLFVPVFMSVVDGLLTFEITHHFATFPLASMVNKVFFAIVHMQVGRFSRSIFGGLISFPTLREKYSKTNEISIDLSEISFSPVPTH